MTNLACMQPDQLFSRTTSGGTDSYLTNPINSTIALANSSGEVKTSYTYDPFGATTSTGSASTNLFQFTGRENDGTGLQYNRARYYSPTGARFISQDPAGFEGSGANLYWYANADPLDFTDPSGKCAAWEGCFPDPIAVAGELASGAANNIQESANQVGNWVSGAPGVVSEVTNSGIYRFAGENWLRCTEGARAGAAGGAVVGSLVGPEGTAPGGVIGGALGCGGTQS